MLKRLKFKKRKRTKLPISHTDYGMQKLLCRNKRKPSKKLQRKLKRSKSKLKRSKRKLKRLLEKLSLSPSPLQLLLLNHNLKLFNKYSNLLSTSLKKFKFKLKPSNLNQSNRRKVRTLTRLQKKMAFLAKR